MLLRAVVERLVPLVPAEVDALTGLELGGIPIVTMLSQLTGLPAVFVRKKAKDYGTCRLAEGGEVAGAAAGDRRGCGEHGRRNHRRDAGAAAARRRDRDRVVRDRPRVGRIQQPLEREPGPPPRLQDERSECSLRSAAETLAAEPPPERRRFASPCSWGSSISPAEAPSRPSTEAACATGRAAADWLRWRGGSSASVIRDRGAHGASIWVHGCRCVTAGAGAFQMSQCADQRHWSAGGRVI